MVIYPETGDLGESPGQNRVTVPNAFIASHKVANPDFLPAWQPVAKRQALVAPSYWLIRQPDHAALSGEFAAHFRTSGFPPLSPDAIQAIGQHDSGWSAFPFEAALDLDPPISNGHPVSFLEFSPEDFLQAWGSSIDNAEQISPLAGRMVSGHFYRLGQGRLAAQVDEDRNRSQVKEFLHLEHARQQRLEPSLRLSANEIETLVDVLQFCDVLSLYLCCGAQEAVEFPQSLAGRRIRLQFADGVFRFNPSPFIAGDNPEGLPVRLGVPASRYPHPNRPEITRLNFLLC
jgi:uncharacterized protein DUF3891